MGPFLAISRHDVVNLSSPWDPERVLQEYLEQSNGRPVPALAPAELAALGEGGDFRFELQHRWMGRVQAEMRVAVLSARQVNVAVDGAWWLTWWLRPVAILFRGRLRRWLNGRIDEMLEELSEDTPVEAPGERGDDSGLAPDLAGGEPETGLRWTLEILTPAGERVYRHTEGRL